MYTKIKPTCNNVNGLISLQFENLALTRTTGLASQETAKYINPKKRICKPQIYIKPDKLMYKHNQEQSSLTFWVLQRGCQLQYRSDARYKSNAFIAAGKRVYP